MPLTRSRPLALAVLLLLTAPALLAPLSSAGSHSYLTVELWNEDATGLGVGDHFVVWAQVYNGQTPVNASSVVFKLGLHLPPLIFAASYNGSYAGSPGLYNATVTVAANDTQFGGVTVLSVDVTEGPDSASSSRIVLLQFPGNPLGGGPGPWGVHVGLDNIDELGGHIAPGDELVWRVDTTFNGTPANSSTLTADLFMAPHVTFTEAAVPLTPVNVGPGVYEVRSTVPAAPVESLQMIVQAHVSDLNDAWSNATADLWFHDTVVHFTTADASRVAGMLTVGNGTSILPGLTVALDIVEDGNPTHSIGWINGTTNATGEVAFNITNDGTTGLLADGWVNSSTHSQRVWRTFTVRDFWIPDTPDTSRFDAIVLADPSAVPWEGNQSFPYEFWDNGTLLANSTVNAYVWNSRGSWGAQALTTDAQGRANLTLDFDTAPPFAFDDLPGGGINATFRIVQGPDASAADGNWWGEDEEHLQPNPALPFVRMLVDTNLTFTTDTLARGTPFGVGTKYTGAQSTAGWEGAAAVIPGSFISQIGGSVGDYAVWTGSDMPSIIYMQGGDGQEFYGCAQIPSYWPSTTYSVIGVQLPNLAMLSSEAGLPTGGALWWAEVPMGGSVAQFTPVNDTTPPTVLGVTDASVALGQSLSLKATAYDNSLDFCSAGNYTWSFSDPDYGTFQAYGPRPTVTFASAGIITANLTVTDSSGNAVVVPFTVTVMDGTPPTVNAGPDQVVTTGDLVNFSGVATDNDAAFPASGSLNWTFTYNGTPVDLAGANASFQFDLPGVYNVTLTGVDPSGNAANDTLLVTVHVPDTQAPTVDAGPDQMVRMGTTVAFAGSATDNDPAFPTGALVFWNFSYNGSVVTLTGFTPTFTFDLPGTYLVTLEVSDVAGNMGAATMTVEVLPPDTEAPTVVAGPDVNIIAGSTVTFDGSATDNDPLWPAGSSVTWTFDYGGSQRTFSGYAFSFTFDVRGTYNLTLTVSDFSGNTGTDTLTVTVIPPDTTPPSIQPIADMTVMTGDVVTFEATASDDSANFTTAGHYNWTFTAGGVAQDLSGSTATFTFATAENVAVTLTVVDGSGNAASLTFTVHVHAPDTTPPNILLANTNLTVYVGQDVLLAASAEDGGSPISNASAYQWSFTEGGTPVTLTGGQAHYTFSVPGTYNITLRVSDAAGNVKPAYMEVTVTEAPPGTTNTGGLDPMLLVGAIIVVAALAGVAFLMVRKRPPAEPVGGMAGDAGKP